MKNGKFDLYNSAEFQAAHRFKQQGQTPSPQDTNSKKAQSPQPPSLSSQIKVECTLQQEPETWVDEDNNDVTNEDNDVKRTYPANAVKYHFPMATVADEAIIPEGYTFTTRVHEGIVRVSEDTSTGTKLYTPLLPYPIWISKIQEGEFGKQNEKLELRHINTATMQEKMYIVDRELLAKPSSITALNKYGYPVTNDSRFSEAHRLIRYLKEYEKVNAAVIPREKSVDKLGWHEGMSVFAPYSPHITVNPEGSEEKRLLEEGYVKKGESLEAYIEDIKSILTGHSIPIFVYALSFASPLLKVINAPSFSIELARNSGYGKSVCQRIALGVYGNPNKLIRGWKSTSYGFEILLDFSDSLPSCLEDAHLQDNVNFIADAFYMAYNGSGKTRGSKTGGNRRTPSFCGILISSTENESVKRINLDGIMRRLITITEKPFKDKVTAKEIGKQVERMHQKHYGLAGERWIKYIIAKSSEWEKWASYYLDVVDNLDRIVDSGHYNPIDKDIMKEQNRLIAVAQVALELMQRCFNFGFDTQQVIQDVAHVIYGQLDNNSKVYHALRKLVSWAITNRYAYFTYHSSSGKQYGTIKDGEYIAFSETSAEDYLKEHGFNPSIIEQWKQLGIAEMDKEGKNPQVTITKGKKSRMVKLKWNQLEQICGKGFYEVDEPSNDEPSDDSPIQATLKPPKSKKSTRQGAVIHFK